MLRAPRLPVALGPLLILLLGLLVAPGTCSNSVQVSTGENFVQAIIELGQDGGDVTLELSNPISLDNATWNVGKQAAARGFFMNSSLTVRGTSADGPVVLDAAMKAWLAPINALTVVTWENIVFVDLCTVPIVFDPDIMLTGLYSNAMFFLPRSRSVQNTIRRGCTVYISRREFLGLIHWLALDLTPFEYIQDGWAKVALQYAPDTGTIVRSMDEHSILVEYMNLAGGTDINTDFRTTGNPRDPLGIALPPYGSLMPHRMCSPDGNSTGPLLTERQVHTANFTASPTWTVTSSAEFLAELQAISDHEFVDQESHPAIQDLHVEIMFILKDISLASENLQLERRPFLKSDTMLHGPLSPDRPILDFADKEGVLRIGSNTRFFIKNITITGLKPVADFGEEGTQELGRSCLKLAAISRRERQVVHVADITLEVPKAEFLILLSAAHRGTGWQDGAPTTAYTLQDISVFEPRVYDRSQLLLDKYTGWDVEGQRVMLVPSEPLTDQEYQGVLDGDKEGVDKVALGVGVGIGIGVGLPVIIVSAWLLAVALRRKRKGLAHQKEGTGTRNAPQPEEGHASILVKPSTKGDLSDIEGWSIPTSKQMNRTKDDSGHHCTASTSSKISHKLEEAATIQHMETSNAMRSIIGPSDGSLPAFALDKIEIDELSMPIQKMAEDQRASLPPRNFDSLVRQEVDGLLRGGAPDDALRLEVLIGKGAWGAVYKGSWKGLTVAVKTVLFTARANEENQAIPNEARAVLEAAVCISLSHPNIVSTYHYSIKQVSHHGHDDSMGLQVEGSADMLEDWKLFLVLEYCHCCLSMGMRTGLFGRGGRLNFEKVAHILLDVAQGAAYLHENHIIHGDLKPDNILVKANSSSPVGLTAKITDFGLSTNLGPTATHMSNIRHGTPYYCSPEVAIDGRATKASDVFSFGVVFCELCSGVQPFQKVGGDEYVKNPSFPHFPPFVPGTLKDLALRCMDTNASARPTFQEIVLSLQGIVEAQGSLV